jgi:phosphatidylserine decarboxylase
MKKLILLETIACLLIYLVGSFLGFRLWRIVVFGCAPVFLSGFGWLWWFRNVFFFRDPERVIPEGEELIVSPADGRVMYLYPVRAGEVISNKKGQRIRIRELAKTELSEAEGWLLGIYMTPFDVHFNRAPISGEIRSLHYHKTGLNLPMVDLWEYLNEYLNFTLLRKAVDMFAAPFHLENERLTMKIRNGTKVCFIILIADRFVNKIKRFYQEGQFVQNGEKISFIERGSQTDLFIPFGRVRFDVKPGDQVRAGTTIIGTVAS